MITKPKYKPRSGYIEQEINGVRTLQKSYIQTQPKPQTESSMYDELSIIIRDTINEI